MREGYWTGGVLDWKGGGFLATVFFQGLVFIQNISY